jgi:hydrogenase-4 component B
VQHGTGARNLERLGGLMRRMPVTGALALVGLLALAALPPLNGFASEWMLLQSLLGMGLAAPGWLAVLAALAVAALALTSALALATGVKALGVGFLGMPRSERAAHAHEAPATMLAPMAILGALCAVLGLLPALALAPVDAVAITLGAAPATVAPLDWARLTPPAPPGASISPLAIGLGLALLAPLAWGALRLICGPAGRRVSPPWVCGMALTARMQYTSAAFAKPIRLIFRAIIRPARAVAATYRTPDAYFFRTMTYRGETRPLAERYLYATVHRGVLAAARATRVIQNGHTRIYLAYVFVTLVVLLFFAR